MTMMHTSQLPSIPTLLRKTVTLYRERFLVFVVLCAVFLIALMLLSIVSVFLPPLTEASLLNARGVALSLMLLVALFLQLWYQAAIIVAVHDGRPVLASLRRAVASLWRLFLATLSVVIVSVLPALIIFS